MQRSKSMNHGAREPQKLRGILDRVDVFLQGQEVQHADGLHHTVRSASGSQETETAVATSACSTKSSLAAVWLHVAMIALVFCNTTSMSIVQACGLVVISCQC